MGIYEQVCKGGVCSNKLKWKSVIIGFVLSIIFDVADFFIGRIPGFGTLFDLGGSLMAYKLWGPVGLLQLWEVIDITDQADGFVPTVTISGVFAMIYGGTQDIK